jgi:uncharacterized phage protein (TIGR01671 family)
MENRTIKFRAWDKVHCRFLEDWCYKSGEGMYYEFHGTGGMAVPDNVDEIIFEQYTGLKDKKGAEIYEGDVMCSRHCEYRDGVRTENVLNDKPEGEVKFGEIEIGTGSAGHGMGSGSRFVSGFYTDNWNKSNPSQYEVIGNIHQNPELVQKQVEL